jgi:hypothetical protein
VSASWQRESAGAAMIRPRTMRRDLVLFVLALTGWLMVVHTDAWLYPRFPSAIALACVAYALAMCKFLGIAPLLRPVLAIVPVLAAIGTDGLGERPPDAGWLARSTLVAASVVLASFGYFLLAVYRYCAGYVLRTPDGGTDGLDTDKLLHEYEALRCRFSSRSKLKILFPDSDWRQWLVSTLRSAGDELAFASLTPENIRASDVVVPLKIRDLIEIDPHRHLLADSPVPVPSKECVALCDDKYRLNQALIAHGFGRYVPAMDDGVGYPYLLKKKSDEWAVNCHLVTSAEQEQQYASLLGDPDYFRQEFVPGRSEYTTHLLMRKRKVVAAISIKFVFAEDLHTKGRECVASYSKVCRSRHLDLFAAMLRSIGFDGLCCVNYKIVDGRPAIFEINPRFGASLVPWFSIFLRRAVGRRQSTGLGQNAIDDR